MKDMAKIDRIISSSAFALLIWLFWWLLYPQALGIQEQNQLFLWSWQYLGERLSVAGGLADWLSECIVQFYYVKWLGALLLAGVFVLIQVLTWKLAREVREDVPGEWYPLSFVPALLLLLHMGDQDVLLSFGVALVMMLWTCLCFARCDRRLVFGAVAIPALYWLAGPVMWVFAGFAIAFIFVKDGFGVRSAVIALAAAALAFGWVLLARYTVLVQYAPKSVFLGINYYRMPLMEPWLQIVTAVVAAAIAFVPAFRLIRTLYRINFVVLVGLAVWGVKATYDKDTYELIAYDQLVRQEKWEEVLKRAEKYTVKADIACVYVNLSLFMTGRMDSLTDYWQCGTQGLMMPRVRDYISNVGTGEVFWRLGMVNSALRYAFDTQESTYNNRKSGRAMCRMAECQIVNGRYKVASKYLDLLKKSTFYRGWALDRERFLGDDDAVESDPVYGYLRTVKFERDFLYYYDQMDKMLAILYNQNKANVMAASYFVAWKKLQGGER